MSLRCGVCKIDCTSESLLGTFHVLFFLGLRVILREDFGIEGVVIVWLWVWSFSCEEFNLGFNFGLEKFFQCGLEIERERERASLWGHWRDRDERSGAVAIAMCSVIATLWFEK